MNRRKYASLPYETSQLRIIKIEEIAIVEDANEVAIILLREYLFRCALDRSEKRCNILFNFGLTFDRNASEPIETDLGSKSILP
ncbi:MAG: hypothetical protein NTV01_21730 [Bacteroidia bacterium]|nr:hypothetical protein [Bacteroidia bacterium]